MLSISSELREKTDKHPLGWCSALESLSMMHWLKLICTCKTRPVGRGVNSLFMHPLPSSQKGPADGVVKDLKWYKIMWWWWDWQFQCNSSSLRITNFKMFPGEHAPRPPLKPYILRALACMAYHTCINISTYKVGPCSSDMHSPWKILATGLRTFMMQKRKRMKPKPKL